MPKHSNLYTDGPYNGAFDFDTVQDVALKARIRLRDPHLLVVRCCRDFAELWLLTEVTGPRGPAPGYRTPVQVLSPIEWHTHTDGHYASPESCIFLPWLPSRCVSGVGSVKVHARGKKQP